MIFAGSWQSMICAGIICVFGMAARPIAPPKTFQSQPHGAGWENVKKPPHDEGPKAVEILRRQ